MKKMHYVELISYLYVILFVYAATSKLFDYQKFTVQLGQSPMLTQFAGWLAWMVPSLELAIAGLLLTPPLRFIGLYASFTLMTMFSAYIFMITNYSSYVPCSCGGILQHMSWGEHLVFNLVFVALALIAIIIYAKILSESTVHLKI